MPTVNSNQKRYSDEDYLKMYNNPLFNEDLKNFIYRLLHPVYIIPDSGDDIRHNEVARFRDENGHNLGGFIYNQDRYGAKGLSGENKYRMGYVLPEVTVTHPDISYNLPWEGVSDLPKIMEIYDLLEKLYLLNHALEELTEKVKEELLGLALLSYYENIYFPYDLDENKYGVPAYGRFGTEYGRQQIVKDQGITGVDERDIDNYIIGNPYVWDLVNGETTIPWDDVNDPRWNDEDFVNYVLGDLEKLYKTPELKRILDTRKKRQELLAAGFSPYSVTNTATGEVTEVQPAEWLFADYLIPDENGNLIIGNSPNSLYKSNEPSIYYGAEPNSYLGLYLTPNEEQLYHDLTTKKHDSTSIFMKPYLWWKYPYEKANAINPGPEYERRNNEIKDARKEFAKWLGIYALGMPLSIINPAIGSLYYGGLGAYDLYQMGKYDFRPGKGDPRYEPNGLNALLNLTFMAGALPRTVGELSNGFRIFGRSLSRPLMPYRTGVTPTTNFTRASIALDKPLINGPARAINDIVGKEGIAAVEAPALDLLREFDYDVFAEKHPGVAFDEAGTPYQTIIENTSDGRSVIRKVPVTDIPVEELPIIDEATGVWHEHPIMTLAKDVTKEAEESALLKNVLKDKAIDYANNVLDVDENNIADRIGTVLFASTLGSAVANAEPPANEVSNDSTNTDNSGFGRFVTPGTVLLSSWFLPKILGVRRFKPREKGSKGKDDIANPNAWFYWSPMRIIKRNPIKLGWKNSAKRWSDINKMPEGPNKKTAKKNIVEEFNGYRAGAEDFEDLGKKITLVLDIINNNGEVSEDFKATYNAITGYNENGPTAAKMSQGLKDNWFQENIWKPIEPYRLNLGRLYRWGAGAYGLGLGAHEFGYDFGSTNLNPIYTSKLQMLDAEDKQLAAANTATNDTVPSDSILPPKVKLTLDDIITIVNDSIN